MSADQVVMMLAGAWAVLVGIMWTLTLGVIMARRNDNGGDEIDATDDDARTG